MLLAQYSMPCPGDCGKWIEVDDRIGTPDHMADTFMCEECVERYNFEAFGPQMTLWSSTRSDDDLASSLYYRRLAEPSWKRLKRERILASGCACDRCGRQDRPLELHHKTYDHLGEEEDYPEDLEVLCDICHAEEHGLAA